DVAATKRAGQRKRNREHIGCPLGFLADVCRLTEGRTTLVVALSIYRRTIIKKSKTVTLPTSELVDLGIDRHRKREGLAKLEAAGGLIRIKRKGVGRAAKITLTWRPS